MSGTREKTRQDTGTHIGPKKHHTHLILRRFANVDATQVKLRQRTLLTRRMIRPGGAAIREVFHEQTPQILADSHTSTLTGSKEKGNAHQHRVPAASSIRPRDRLRHLLLLSREGRSWKNQHPIQHCRQIFSTEWEAIFTVASTSDADIAEKRLAQPTGQGSMVSLDANSWSRLH